MPFGGGSHQRLEVFEGLSAGRERWQGLPPGQGAGTCWGAAPAGRPAPRRGRSPGTARGPRCLRWQAGTAAPPPRCPQPSPVLPAQRARVWGVGLGLGQSQSPAVEDAVECQPPHDAPPHCSQPPPLLPAQNASCGTPCAEQVLTQAAAARHDWRNGLPCIPSLCPQSSKLQVGEAGSAAKPWARQQLQVVSGWPSRCTR